jgi:hypothetical protein
MESISAATLGQSFDCAVRGCPNEAEVEGGLCRHCKKAARERAREGAAHAGKLETGALALIGLARELDAELAAWHADVEDARAQVAKPR